MNLLKKNKEKTRVLLVDDEPVVLETSRAVLVHAGFEVVFAASCTEALQQMEKQPVDVMLLDIQLPDANGLAFLTKFKRMYPQVPVVMLTSLGYDESLMQAALQNGAAGYVSKGVNTANVVAAIDNALKSRVSSGSSSPT